MSARSPRRGRRAASGGARRDRTARRLSEPDAQQLDRPRHGVVDLLRAVDGDASPAEPGVARSRHRSFAGRRERAHVADRAAARERTTRGREPDELRDPANGLILDLRRCAGIDRQIDVVGVGEEVGEGTDLEPARADEREVARPRLRDRLVEDARGVIERLVDRASDPTAAPLRGAAARDRPAAAPRAGTGRSFARPRRPAATACSSASSRGASSRSGRSGCVIVADGTQNSGSPDILRMEVSQHLARGRPAAHHHRDDQLRSRASRGRTMVPGPSGWSAL